MTEKQMENFTALSGGLQSTPWITEPYRKPPRKKNILYEQ